MTNQQLQKHQQISLNGEWQFKCFYGEDWRWRDSHKPLTRDVRGWHTGAVPGSVQHDLWRAGEIPDPYFERNSLLIEWVPQRTWIYKRTFNVESALKDNGQRVRLCFEGIDYEAEIFLNGESLGHHRGLYTPTTFEVADRLNYGRENLLVVVIEAAPDEQPQIGRTSRVRTTKGRMTYWWDFCPRMIHLGIRDRVYLDVTGPASIENIFVRPQLAEDLQHADLSVSISLSSIKHTVVEVETTIHTIAHSVAHTAAKGKEVSKVVTSVRSQHALAPGITDLNQMLEVDKPLLWWPNGHGDQPLYSATVSVTEIDSIESDRREATFGIRKVEFAPNDTADNSARPYTLVVNGRKVYITGWNWVPMDIMYGVEQPAKLERLLILARRANVNMLRVWGGGLIEKEAFYNLCDRLGILVWQEFIQSSSGIDNVPPEDEAYRNMLVYEAEQIIPHKRNHPSLAIWCGGNELQAGPEKPLDESHPVLAALYATVRRLDPDRLWLPTSPSGPVFSNSLENIEREPFSLHDVHGPWEQLGLTKQYTLYNRGTSLLHTEFGAEGITNLKTLKKTVSEQNRWPVTLDNAVWEHLGAWWVKQPQWRESLGDVQNLETLVRGTQYLQAEAVRYAIESNRRRMYQNSGTLPWQFDEPYPMAACTSAVDYYAQPKPLYYAVGRAYESLQVSAKFAAQTWVGKSNFEAEIWLSNLYPQAFDGATLDVKLVGVSGKVYATHSETLAISANASSKAADVRFPLAEVEELFFLDLYMWIPEMGSAQNRYLFAQAENLSSALTVPATTLEVRPNESSGFVTITNWGEHAALFLWLEDGREPGTPGYVYFDDNHFCLLPGESRSIAVAWSGVPEDAHRLSVCGWNTATINVVAGAVTAV